MCDLSKVLTVLSLVPLALCSSSTERQYLCLLNAEQALAKGQFSVARDAIQTALDINPQGVENRLSLAQLYVYQGQYGQALDLLEALYKDYPQNHTIKRLFIPVLLIQQNSKQAIAYLEQRDNAELDEVLMTLYWRQRNFSAIQQRLSALMTQDPQNSLYRKQYAQSLIAQGKIDEAESSLREAIALSNTPDELWVILVDFLARYRNVDIALAEMIPLLEPDSPASWHFKLAQLYQAKKQYREAESLLEPFTHSPHADIAQQAKYQLARLYREYSPDNKFDHR